MIRTQRGERLFREATGCGDLVATGGLDIQELYEWQGHIIRRREAALARLLGTAVRSGVVPRVGGYRLVRAAQRTGMRGSVRNFRGAWERAGHAREQTAPRSPGDEQSARAG